MRPNGGQALLRLGRGICPPALLFLLGPFFLPAAGADVIDCRDLSGQHRALLQDDVRRLPEADSTQGIESFRRRVASRIARNLRAVEAEVVAPDEPPVRVLCRGRWPEGQKQLEPLVDELDQRGVVFEVWGEVDSTETDTGESVFRAKIECASIPLCNLASPGFRDQGFRPASEWFAAPGASVLPDSCDYALGFKGLAYVGLGIHALNERRFDAAYSFLHLARCLLTQAGDRLATTVGKLMEETVRRAQAAGRASVLSELLGDGSEDCQP